MKIRRPVSMILAIVITLSAIGITSVAALGISNGWFTDEWIKNEAKAEELQENNVVKYEKPSIGEIVGDGAYPDEVKSNASDAAVEKQWYEYISYSQTPVGIYNINPIMRICYYDPYDYSYGMIMEINESLTDFSSSNSISFSHTDTNGFTWGLTENINANISNSVETKTSIPFADMTYKFQWSIGISISSNQSWNSSHSDTKNMTYSALYFNNNGTPYQWKVISYTIFIPLYCKVQYYLNGEWVTNGTGYCKIATVQGTCREYIKNDVAYIEHWGTGEPVSVDNFWKGFFTADGLKEAYKNKLTPNS